MRYFPNVSRVRALTTVRRTRALPRAGQVLVRSGQRVSPIQVIASVPAPDSYHLLNASEVLGIDAEKIEEFLLVEPGMQLERGMPLMRQKTWYGRSILYRCPIDGYLDSIRDGCLVIVQDGDYIELRALLHGTVVQVFPNRLVTIEVKGGLIEAAWDSAKEGFGRLKLVTDEPDQVLQDIPESGVHDRVVVAGKVGTLGVLKGLEGRTARGLIAGSMPSDLARLCRTFSFPVILTDGIGDQPMASPIFELLKQSEGREASLFPAESGSRPQRSQVIIPLPTSLSSETHSDEWGALRTGSQVRVLGIESRSPVGTVIRMYREGKALARIDRIPGADVELANGQVLFVPVTNLDVIA